MRGDTARFGKWGGRPCRPACAGRRCSIWQVGRQALSPCVCEATPLDLAGGTAGPVALRVRGDTARFGTWRDGRDRRPPPQPRVILGWKRKRSHAEHAPERRISTDSRIRAFSACRLVRCRVDLKPLSVSVRVRRKSWVVPVSKAGGSNETRYIFSSVRVLCRPKATRIHLLEHRHRRHNTDTRRSCSAPFAFPRAAL